MVFPLSTTTSEMLFRSISPIFSSISSYLSLVGLNVGSNRTGSSALVEPTSYSSCVFQSAFARIETLAWNFPSSFLFSMIAALVAAGTSAFTKSILKNNSHAEPAYCLRSVRKENGDNILKDLIRL